MKHTARQPARFPSISVDLMDGERYAILERSDHSPRRSVRHGDMGEEIAEDGRVSDGDAREPATLRRPEVMRMSAAGGV